MAFIDLEALQEKLNNLALLRDTYFLEISTRTIQGRRSNPSLLYVSDAELSQELAWAREKIDSLLSPLEGR